VENVNIVFKNSTFWRHHKLFWSGQYFACDWRVGWGRIKKMNSWTYLTCSGILDLGSPTVAEMAFKVAHGHT